MSSLILVGGASASGKSTFINKLLEKNASIIPYRRVNAFFDSAKEKGFAKEQAFEKVTSKEADEYFLKVCLSHEIIISDIHYGVQLKRDSAFVFEKEVQDISEEYVPTISKELIDNLLNNGVTIYCILITCNKEILYNRAIKRQQNNERKLRARSLKDVEKERDAEYYYWKKIIDNNDVNSLVYDTEFLMPDDIANDVNNVLQKLTPSKNYAIIKNKKKYRR